MTHVINALHPEHAARERQARQPFKTCVAEVTLELTLRSATFSENVLSRKNKQTNKKTQIKTEISLVVAMH